MRKILAFGLVALALMLASQQQVSAWSKYNFGVGLNIGWQGGGNSVLWGLFKGAPGPGMDGGFGGDGFGGYGGFGGPGGYGPGAYGPGYAPSSPEPLQAKPDLKPDNKPVKPTSAESAQTVGYFPYADPAVGYYPMANPYAGYTYPYYNYPMYYYYPAYGR